MGAPYRRIPVRRAWGARILESSLRHATLLKCDETQLLLPEQSTLGREVALDRIFSFLHTLRAGHGYPFRMAISVRGRVAHIKTYSFLNTFGQIGVNRSLVVHSILKDVRPFPQAFEFVVHPFPGGDH